MVDFHFRSRPQRDGIFPLHNLHPLSTSLFLRKINTTPSTHIHLITYNHPASWRIYPPTPKQTRGSEAPSSPPLPDLPEFHTRLAALEATRGLPTSSVRAPTWSSIIARIVVLERDLATERPTTPTVPPTSPVLPPRSVRPRRTYVPFSEEENAHLLRVFSTKRYPTHDEAKALGVELRMSHFRILSWFVRRRGKQAKSEAATYKAKMKRDEGNGDEDGNAEGMGGIMA